MHGSALCGKTSASRQLCNALKPSMSVSHVGSSLSDHLRAECTAHDTYAPAILCFFEDCISAFLLLRLLDTLCIRMSVHRLCAMVWSCRAEHRLSQRICNRASMRYMLCLVMQSRGRSVTAYLNCNRVSVRYMSCLVVQGGGPSVTA